MKKTLSFFIAAAVLATLGGCNTIQGIGKDIQAAGKGIQTGSETVEDEITGRNDELAGG